MIARILASGLLAATVALAGCGETEESSPTPSAAQTLTFVVDTTYTDADGNALAEVKEGEKVYVVGSFTSWNPNNETYAMTDNGDGTWSLTLELPHTGLDEVVIEEGVTIEYKFAKTASSSDEWSEGLKDVVEECSNGAAPGLAEFSLTYTITAESHTLDTFKIEAWRDTAEAYGYTSC